jgi:hypothetical protein
MKHISEYGITYLGSIINESHIAKLGIQTASKKSQSHIARRLSELANAHLGSKEYYLKAYAKYCNQLLNLHNKKSEEIEIALPDIERAAYVFIISAKNSLDLLVCILDLLEHKKIREEYKLPDFFSKKYLSLNSFVNKELNKIQESDWAVLLHEYRNKILHRGYTIKIEPVGIEYKACLTKTETIIISPEIYTELPLHSGIELMDDEIIKIEEIMQGLTVDLCKAEYLVSNYFVDQNLIGFDKSELNRWIVPALQLINSY